MERPTYLLVAFTVTAVVVVVATPAAAVLSGGLLASLPVFGPINSAQLAVRLVGKLACQPAHQHAAAIHPSRRPLLSLAAMMVAPVRGAAMATRS